MDKSKWFDLNNPNLCKPTIYRRLSGYCSPEMYVDPAGLRIYETDGMLWLKNELIRESNNSYPDVIAVIPKSQVLSLYTLLQTFLKDRGFLNKKNELPEQPAESSGFTSEWEKTGLPL